MNWEEKLSSVAMINIVSIADGNSNYTYSLWKLEDNKLYLFDLNYKIGHILFLDWKWEEIELEPGSYFVTTNKNLKLRIDCYFGGALTK